MALFAYFLFPLWYINNPSYIDPWIYWGTAEVPSYTFTYFGDTYYARRWTLIAPLMLFQNLFDPFAAQVYFHTINLFLVLGLMATLVLRLTGRLRPALLVVGLTGTTGYTVMNIGLTYHQGIGLMLFFALCLTVWNVAESKHFAMSLVVAGSLYGLLIITYGFCLYFFPAFVALLWIQIYSRTKALGSSLIGLRMVQAMSLAAFGFLLLTLIVDQLVGKLFNQEWTLLPIYLAGLSDVGSTFSPEGNYWQQLVDAFANPGTFAIASLISVGLILQVFPRESNRSQVTRWSIFSFIILLPYLIGTPIKNNGLWWPWTNIYLFSILLISVAILLDALIEKIFTSKSGRRHQTAIIVLVFLTTWILFQERILSKGPTPRMLALLSIVLVALGSLTYWIMNRPHGVLNVVNASLRSRLIIASSCSLILGVIMGLGVSVSSWYPTWAGTTFSNAASARAQVNTLSSEIRGIAGKAVREERKVWVLDLRPHSGWSTLVSSLYGMYSALGLGVPPPALDCSTQADWILSFANSTAVVLGSVSQDVAAEEVLKQFAECDEPEIKQRASESRPAGEYWFDLIRKD